MRADARCATQRATVVRYAPSLRLTDSSVRAFLLVTTAFDRGHRLALEPVAKKFDAVEAIGELYRFDRFAARPSCGRTCMLGSRSY
jgi:hypothetical protein